VTTPREVPWARDPHTAAKHELYRGYLRKWFPIMLRGWSGDITYAEGFAGPGVYKGGEPGSPVVAIRALLDEQSLRPLVKRVRFLFVDAEPRCTNLLEQQLHHATNQCSFEEMRDQHNIDVAVATERCEPHLRTMLTEHGAWGHPVLAVLDTFGGSVSVDLLRTIAANPGSEVIITVQPQYFTRFATDLERAHGDRVFGGTDWREVINLPSEQKARWLLERYRNTVRAAGFPFVLDFELVDARGQSLFLVFGTTHRRGLEKMKEAMWEVDETFGLGYRDPRDPQQQTLEVEIEPQTAPLRRLLVQHLSRRPSRTATLQELRDFALFETVYKPGQVRAEVRKLLDQGALTRDDRPGDVMGATVLALREPPSAERRPA
jgi:three-Cys-motif partner protein